MSWKDETFQSSFRGIPFVVDRVTLVGGKKGSEHDRPKRKGGSAEDLGPKIVHFQVDAFVNGADYLDQRDALEEALDTKGPGELVLPTRGSIGALAREWSITEEVNREGGTARFTIDFVETTLPNLIQSVAAPEQQVLAFGDESIELLAQEYTEQIDLEDTASVEQVLTDVKASKQTITDQLKGVVEEVNSEFNALSSIVDGTIDDLLPEDPLTILTNIQQLIALPAAVENSFSALQSKYKELIEDTLSTYPLTYISSRLAGLQCVHAETIAGSALVALGTAATTSDFSSRESILAANALIKNLFDSYTERLDEYSSLFISGGQFYEELEQNRFTPSYDNALKIKAVIDNTSLTLVNRAFTLPREAVVVLDRDRTLIDLCFELYGNMEKVEELIDVNAISDPYLIPAFTHVVYYV